MKRNGRLYCAYGDHPIANDVHVYTTNPLDDYGRRELLCCEPCIRKPENAGAMQKMLECANVNLNQRKALERYLKTMRCRRCDGTGRWRRVRCPVCDGGGRSARFTRLLRQASTGIG